MARLRIANALYIGACAKLKVYLVSIIDGLLSHILTDKLGQIAAHLTAKGQLAVGECACAGKAGSNMAIGLAVDAVTGLILGAVTLFHRLTLFHYEYALLAAFFYHFNGSEYARRTCADYYYILFHLQYLPNSSSNKVNRQGLPRGLAGW